MRQDDGEPDALERLRREQERRLEEFRTEQEETVRRLGRGPDPSAGATPGERTEPTEATEPIDPGPPTYHPTYLPQPGGWGPPNVTVLPPTHPKAVWALVLSIVAWPLTLVCGIGVIAALMAVVFAVQAQIAIRRAGGQIQGDGQARAGMIIAVVYLVLVAATILGLVLLTEALV